MWTFTFTDIWNGVYIHEINFKRLLLTLNVFLCTILTPKLREKTLTIIVQRGMTLNLTALFNDVMFTLPLGRKISILFFNWTFVVRHFHCYRNNFSWKHTLLDINYHFSLEARKGFPFFYAELGTRFTPWHIVTVWNLFFG